MYCTLNIGLKLGNGLYLEEWFVDRDGGVSGGGQELDVGVVEGRVPQEQLSA